MTLRLDPSLNAFAQLVNEKAHLSVADYGDAPAPTTARYYERHWSVTHGANGFVLTDLLKGGGYQPVELRVVKVAIPKNVILEITIDRLPDLRSLLGIASYPHCAALRIGFNRHVPILSDESKVVLPGGTVEALRDPLDEVLIGFDMIGDRNRAVELLKTWLGPQRQHERGDATSTTTFDA